MADDGARWESFAECAGKSEVMLSDSNKKTLLAKEFCKACPVKAECLDLVISDFSLWKGPGVWGGLSASERNRMSLRKFRQENKATE